MKTINLWEDLLEESCLVYWRKPNAVMFLGVLVMQLGESTKHPSLEKLGIFFIIGGLAWGLLRQINISAD